MAQYPYACLTTTPKSLTLTATTPWSDTTQILKLLILYSASKMWNALSWHHPLKDVVDQARIIRPMCRPLCCDPSACLPPFLTPFPVSLLSYPSPNKGIKKDVKPQREDFPSPIFVDDMYYRVQFCYVDEFNTQNHNGNCVTHVLLFHVLLPLLINKVFNQ